MSKFWEYLVRFRTWLVNLAMALVIVAPDLLNSPQMLAILPAEYQRYVIAAGFLINIWMRPRPAVIATDPEVSIREGRRR